MDAGNEPGRGQGVAGVICRLQRILDAFKKPQELHVATIISSSFLGYFVGILPAAGATPASLMAYGVAKTMSKDPDSFGKGNIGGSGGPGDGEQCRQHRDRCCP